MATTNTAAAPSRQGRRQVTKPSERGLPDPRPVTDYTVTLSTVSGKSRLTISLSQPCVIKSPMWPAIDCTAGALVNPVSSTAVSNTQFYLDYPGLFNAMTAFVQVPYQ